MAQTRTIPVFGKVVTPIGNYYLTSPEGAGQVVPCKSNQGYYPAPVEANFAHVQHVIARFAHSISIEVNLEWITA